MKTILVTGAAGLIGSEVCRQLLEDGFEIVACDNFSMGDWAEVGEKIHWERIDITNRDLETRLDKYRIDAVIHCAAHPGGKSNEEPVLDVEVNALGSMRLFHWCARNKVEVIYLSSSAVYGPGHNSALKETDSLYPGTIYAVCKVACENYLRILGEKYGLKWTVLRLFATYGSGHRANTFQGIVNVLLTQLLSGDKIIVKGSLDRVRGLVYVKDAARAIILALLQPDCRGQIINVSHPEPATVGQILFSLMEILKRKNVEIEVTEGTIGDPFANFADCSTAQKLLKFQPDYSLERGLKELIKDRRGL